MSFIILLSGDVTCLKCGGAKGRAIREAVGGGAHAWEHLGARGGRWERVSWPGGTVPRNRDVRKEPAGTGPAQQGAPYQP